jgi:DNA adenine methylase
MHTATKPSTLNQAQIIKDYDFNKTITKHIVGASKSAVNNITENQVCPLVTSKGNITQNIKQEPVVNTTECMSLLQTLKKKAKQSIEFMKNNLGKIRKYSTERSEEIIAKNIDKPFTAKTMYVNRALIINSKDKTLFNNLDTMNQKEFVNYLKDRNLSILNYDSYSDDSDTKKFVPFSYAGGKQGGNKVSMQKLVRSAFKKHSYKTWVEPFVGAFGATYNVLPVLLEYGIEEIVLNDINKSLINTYRQIQKNPKQVQRHLASIAIEYYKEFGKFKPNSRKEAKALREKLKLEFFQIEVDRKMNARRAALFLYLISTASGGMVKYDIQSKTCDFSSTYEITNIDLLINKVEIFHQVFTSVKTTFKSIKYQTIINKYKNDTNTLMLLDPVYMEYSEEETEKSCSYTYGIDFNHKELLNKLQKVEFDFLYYNNHNPLLQRYARKNSFEYIKTPRVYSNGSKGRTETVEITMINIKTREVKTSNVTNYVGVNNIETAELVA